MKKLCGRNYFEGWYFKNSNGMFTISFIPSCHVDKKGNQKAYLQVVTNDNSYYFEYAKDKFIKDKKCLFVNLEHCIFCTDHIDISINSKQVTIKCELNFTERVPLKYDIMGPFKFAPLMPCRHKIISLSHKVNGYIKINNIRHEFVNGEGYIESDRGSCFPKKYLWTHCNLEKDSVITLSVAQAKVMGIKFPGVIGVILHQGVEYRMATYLGAKIIKWNEKGAQIKQGDMILDVEQLSSKPHDLKAPIKGAMKGAIGHSPFCEARYTFCYKGQTLIDTIANNASFEIVD
ncbi:MAG: tocopherol cyclase family protein [Bacillota bacterium]|mgnify:CR=1 FL=1|jgi:tocopherol cyclase|nr:tocopherol cyclase family protein [Bacillota bacterium]HHU43673.1 hypothetical protein [Clostridiales bacterium]